MRPKTIFLLTFLLREEERVGCMGVLREGVVFYYFPNNKIYSIVVLNSRWGGGEDFRCSS